MYITATEGNMKMWPLWAVAFYIPVNIIYALFINGGNEIVLYRQWFVIEVPFIDSDLLYIGAHYRKRYVI